MKDKHYLLCGAPICSDDPNPNYKNEVIWRPGEKICLKVPYQKFQKIQSEINREVKSGHFRNIDTPYTAHDLETLSI